MGVLYVVPHHALVRKWRQASVQSDEELLPFTIPGLVAKLLQEQGMAYREDAIQEELAVWETVWEEEDHLRFFAPIRTYKGFIRELHWLFQRLSMGEELLSSVPKNGQLEVVSLYNSFQEKLGTWGLTDSGTQIKRAIEAIPSSPLLGKVDSVVLCYLPELSPLEQEFLGRVCFGKKVQKMAAAASSENMTVIQLSSPEHEVEYMAARIREAIQDGVGPDQIGVAFPNLSDYLPLIVPIFERFGIPWEPPATSLSSTTLGKSFFALLHGELEGWHKHNLSQIVEKGWGLPFQLSLDEWRALKLSPPVKGIVRWREQLSRYPGWAHILETITTFAHQFPTQPISQHAQAFQKLLSNYHPTQWPIGDIVHWGEHLKSWDGFFVITERLKVSDHVVDFAQFITLLQEAAEGYGISNPTSFRQKVRLRSLESIVGLGLKVTYLGGMCEGTFPRQRGIHWLTRMREQSQALDLLHNVLSSSEVTICTFAETDFAAKANLPSPLIPTADQRIPKEPKSREHAPRLFYGDGLLSDQAIGERLLKKYQASGLSVSRLNIYARCPYQFYCSQVLEIKHDEVEELELTALDEGRIAHQALERFWRNHLKGPLPSIEDGAAEIRELLYSSFREQNQTPVERVVRQMERFIREDLKSLPAEFRPRILEQEFKGLTIDTAFGPINMHGFVDRIDANENGDFILYDYKTGQNPSVKDILLGRHLQIPVYLLAAGLLLEGEPIGAAFYSLRNSKRVGIWVEEKRAALKIVRKNSGCFDPEGWESQMNYSKEAICQIMEGIFQGRFPIEPVNNACRYCPFQGICRKEVR